MKRVVYLIALIAVSGAAACNGDTPTKPTTPTTPAQDAPPSGVFVSLGLTAGEATFPTGSGSFTKRGVTMTVDQASAITANPGGFYLNIHTAANPNGVARGQLARS